jgi:hypothetical protein
MGATAPCQLSTNVAAVAFISKEAEEPRTSQEYSTLSAQRTNIAAMENPQY